MHWKQLDEDMNRARTLMELFEMRGKFKQMGDTGLTRAKERVDAVVSRYAEKELEEREEAAKARHLGV
jgi:predicted ATPase